MLRGTCRIIEFYNKSLDDFPSNIILYRLHQSYSLLPFNIKNGVIYSMARLLLYGVAYVFITIQALIVLSSLYWHGLNNIFPIHIFFRKLDGQHLLLQNLGYFFGIMISMWIYGVIGYIVLRQAKKQPKD